MKLLIWFQVSLTFAMDSYVNWKLHRNIRALAAKRINVVSKPLDSKLPSPMPINVLDPLCIFLGVCEQLCLAQCCQKSSKACRQLTTHLKVDSRLCMYTVYQFWKSNTGQQKEQLKELLLKNSEFKPYAKFLIDGEPFDPGQIDLPSPFLAGTIFCPSGHPRRFFIGALGRISLTGCCTMAHR